VTGALAEAARGLRGAFAEPADGSGPAPARGLGTYALELLVTAAACFAAARLGTELAYPHAGGATTHGSFIAFWPPIGVGIAALVVYGPRLWPGVVLGDLVAGDYSTPFAVVAAQTIATTLAVVVASALLLRLGARTPGLRVKDVLILIVCAAAGTILGAAAGMLALWIMGNLPAGSSARTFRTWWLSDLAGALVVAPALLTWASARLRPTRRQALEGVALLALMLALASISSQRDVPYVLFPVLIWAALRFGRCGAATALLAAAAITVWHTSDGSGPFVRSSLTDSLLATQLFLAVATLTSMILAAVTAERAASEAAARGLAHEQAALRRIATLVVTEAVPARVFGQVMQEAARALGVASASLVRYEAPGRVCVMGGWSETGALLFPPGSMIELGNENSALVEVYRTGEARRVTYPRDARSPVAVDLRSHGYRSSVAAPVKLADGLWGALVASTLDERPLPAGSEQRLCDFADLVAQALANADAHDKLAASRTRIVEAGDAERRRLERNLHDGAQQRLVSLALQLRLIQSALERRPDDVLGLLQEAQAELARALDELRELARGIHPAILTDRGLGPALEAILARAPLPIELVKLPEDRLPEQVEAAVYYVVAETITNIAKHARAESATVSVTLVGRSASVVISDNGVGGADSSGGSGLRGLADRIEALDGHLRIESPPGRGTRIEARIPCPEA
jgi:signal transduction histidine kinase